MDDIKFAICRLCLEIVQNGSFKLFKNIELNMLDVLTPNDTCINSGSAMCRPCHKNLLTCYEFKSEFLEMIERKKILEDKMLNYEGTQPTKVKVCSFCSENIDDEMMGEIFLGVKGTLLAIMLEKCLPELNTRQMDMAGCTKCFKSLEVMFSFINKWLITEEKLEKYCIAKNIKKNELKLLEVVTFFQSCSGNIAHPQIGNLRISSKYGGSTNHLITSNIKREPDQYISNNIERNEETHKESYINMNPETTQMNNLISSSNSTFISANNSSHPKVKLEPVEDIHEFTGSNEESYMKVEQVNYVSDINNTEHAQINNNLIASNYNNVTSLGSSWRSSVNVGLGEDVNTFGVSKRNKHEDQNKYGKCKEERDIEECSFSSASSPGKFKSSNLHNLTAPLLPAELLQRLLQTGFSWSKWGPELMAEIQAFRPKQITPDRQFICTFRTVDGRILRLRVPPLSNSKVRDKNEYVEMKQTRMPEINPKDVNRSRGKSKNCFTNFEKNKHKDQRNEGKVGKRCLSPSFSSPYHEFTNNKDLYTIEHNETTMKEGLLPPDLCLQDPSALTMPDFANLSQATRRESRSSDLDDDPDKKRRKCIHTSAANPAYKDKLPQSNLRRQSEEDVSPVNISVINKEGLKDDSEINIGNAESAVAWNSTLKGNDNFPLGPYNSSLGELRTTGDPSDWSPKLLQRLEQAALLPENYCDNVNQRSQYIPGDGEPIGVELSQVKVRLEPPDCTPDRYENCTTTIESKEQLPANPGPKRGLPGDSLNRTENKRTHMARVKKSVWKTMSRAVVLVETQYIDKCENYIALCHRCPLGRHEGFCAATIGLAEQLRASHYPWTPELRQRLAAFFFEGSYYNQKQGLKFTTTAGEQVLIKLSPAHLRLNRDDFREVMGINERYFKDSSWKYINFQSESNSWLVEQLLATPEPAAWSPILRRRLATLFPEDYPANNWVFKKINITDDTTLRITVSRDMLGLEPTLEKGAVEFLPKEEPSSFWHREIVAPEHQCKFGRHGGYCSLSIGVAEQLLSCRRSDWSPALSQRLAVFLQVGCSYTMTRTTKFRTVSGDNVQVIINPTNLNLSEVNIDFFKDESWDEPIISDLKLQDIYKQQYINERSEKEARNIISLPSATPLSLPCRIASDWLVRQLLATPCPADWSPMLRKRLATLIPASSPDDEWLIPQFKVNTKRRLYVRICRKMLR